MNNKVKSFIDHPVFIIFCFFLFAFIFFKLGPHIPLSIISQQKGEPFVVDGEGKVFVTPDIAKVTVGVEQSGVSLSVVQDSVNTKSQALVDSLKNLGIDKSDIKTISYNLHPSYDYSAPTTRITGYRVSTNYEITIKDFSKINDVIVTSTSSGANLIGSVSFEVNEETKQQKLQEARDSAVEQAKQKASSLAKSAGITLGDVINISENQVTPVYRTLNAPIDASAGGVPKEIAQPEIQPGQTEIDVTVSITYEIR